MDKSSIGPADLKGGSFQAWLGIGRNGEDDSWESNVGKNAVRFVLFNYLGLEPSSLF